MRRAPSRHRSPWAAASRRGLIARLRRDEAGQSLVLVMMISIMAMLMLSTATTALTGQIKPAKASVDSGEAIAAAQAGLENFLSWVNTNCPPTVGFECASLTTGITNKTGISDPLNQQGVPITGGDGVTSVESYWWTVTFATSGLARVRSVGQVPTGKPDPKYLIKVLVADVDAMPSFNNFQYYTKYETYSAEFVNSFYQARSVQVTSAANLNGTSISGRSRPGTLQWDGTCTYVNASTTPLCDSSHSTNVCDDLYYPNGAGPGRGTNTGWNNASRRPSSAIQDAMGTDSSFAYFTEGGRYTPATGSSVPLTHNDTCDSSMEPNMVMNGPVYSQDAYLVDRGKDTGNSRNSKPNFDAAAYTVWTGSINGSQQPLGANGGYDRAYPGTDGAATLTDNYPTDSSGNSVFPIYQSNALELPEDATEALPLAQCVYTGPTRIQITGTTARITSPLTPAGSSACYQSTGTFSNINTLDSEGQSTTDASGGVVNALVPLSRTLIYVKNPAASVKPTQATVASPVFNTTTNLTLPAATTSDGLTGTWGDDSSYLATAACPAPANPAKRRNFDCEAGQGTPKNDVFTAIKAATDAELATANPTTASLTSAITGQLSAASRTAGIVPGSVWYAATVTAGTPTSTTVTPDAPSGTFLQSTVGRGYTTTAKTWNVTVDRMVCTSLNRGSCINSTTPIVQGVLSRTASAATGTPMNSTENFPWHGKQPGDSGYDAARTYTDPDNDITTYYHGYGDVYVDGVTNANVSIVAEHDIVVTNDLTYNNNTVTNTSNGLALIATHNVRIYRPMTCATDGTLGVTTPGYCPNDLSGAYTDNLSWPVANNFPSYMYEPNNAPSMTNGGLGLIYATVFTLRGSFLADNFYRGEIGYGINIYGGLYQYHRGATSMPYQGRPYQGSGTKMPGISVTYNYDNMRAGQAVNGGLRVPYIPPPDGRLTSNTWNVISISTGS
ncbi:pilus assembly PilX N-terminal domain-containing protein [Jatrophihabitans sp.]|jgi:Tfp pilus assembly protein PilX|uniref:pilus assembly PilX N-terminal domain-containing protein n=1 Tax=Jatrophihabitans sp. TaxID=1932789 RepID=UPI002F18C3CF